MTAYNVNVSTAAVVVRQPAPNEQVFIENNGGVTAWIGATSSVSATTSFPLTPGSRVHWYNGYNIGTATTPMACWAITASGATTLSVNPAVS